MRVIVVNSDSMGQGDVQLGRILVGSFLRKLWAAERKPDAVIFYNSGVKLLTQDSAVLDALEGLAVAGTDLLACGTCVSFFDLRESIVAGRISDMGEIAALLMSADQTITV